MESEASPPVSPLSPVTRYHTLALLSPGSPQSPPWNANNGLVQTRRPSPVGKRQRGSFDKGTSAQVQYVELLRPPKPKREGRPDNDFNYKPTALKWWYLILLLMWLVVLIALTEWAVHSLPSYDNPTLAELSNLSQKMFGRDAGYRRGHFPEKRDQAANITSSSETPVASAEPQASSTSSLPTPAAMGTTGTTGTTGATGATGATGTIEAAGAAGSAAAAGTASRTGIAPAATTTSRSAKRPPPEPSFSAASFPRPSKSTTSSESRLGVFETQSPEGFRKPGQTTAATMTRAGSTSWCFTCATPVFSTAAADYLVTGKITTTIGPKPVTTTRVTVVTEVTTLPPQVTTLFSTRLDVVGNPTIVAIPTTMPGSTSTFLRTISIPPGMAWSTLTSLIPTTISGTPTVVPTAVATLATIVAPLEESDTTTVVLGISSGEYLAGAFLPTVLAVLLVQPLKLIDVNAKLFQPFHALAANPAGAPADASVFLRFYGWPGLLAFPRALRLGQPAVVVAQLLVWFAALLAPFAAESVAVHVPKGCTGGCYGDLGVASVPVRVLEGVLGAILLLLLLLLWLMTGSRFPTGVKQNPWSIAGMASLSLNDGLREVINGVPRGMSRKVEDWEVLKVLKERSFALSSFTPGRQGPEGAKGYGVVVTQKQNNARQRLVRHESDDKPEAETLRGKKRIMSFALLTWWGRGGLLFVFSSVFILLTYYESTAIDSDFERFMDSQGFGVRFFFTTLGVLLGFSMATFFRCVAVLSPYLMLSRSPMPAARSILLSPPTNPYTGLHAAWRQRHIYLGLLALATILSEVLLPVTLAHVPFSLTETHETQVVCSWMSVAILAVMILVVAGSFAIRWPHMPVDPRTVAGALTYVCDSRMLERMEGLAAMDKRERKQALDRTGARYTFGDMTGVSGRKRVGVDAFGKQEYG